jgi:hypothetical protein
MSSYEDRTAQLYWTRDGDDWVLKLGRRKLGRVFRDEKYPSMWRSRRADGRLSDTANLSWAKHAVLSAAERNIRHAETPVKEGVF